MAVGGNVANGFQRGRQSPHNETYMLSWEASTDPSERRCNRCVHSLYSRSGFRHHLHYSLQVDLARVLLQEARHLRRRRHRLTACELQRHDALPEALPVGNGRVGLVTPGDESGGLGDAGRAATSKGRRAGSGWAASRCHATLCDSWCWQPKDAER